MLAQLAKLRAAAEESQRKEAAAKAVLEAAKAASREGRALSAGERASAERPILSPGQATTGSPPQVLLWEFCQLCNHSRVGCYQHCRFSLCQ